MKTSPWSDICGWPHSISAPGQRFPVEKCCPVLCLWGRMDRVTPESGGAGSTCRSKLSAGSRISVHRRCKNAAVCKLFNSLGFALPTCSSKAEGKVCVRGVRRAETHGSQGHQSFTSFKCTFQPSLLPIPTALYAEGAARGWRGWTHHFPGDRLRCR